jgi:tellurite methyltransferase
MKHANEHNRDSMTSEGKWNQKYRAKPLVLKAPDHFVVDHAEQLVPGSVLDLASGDGRNSLFLAGRGFCVTALDISDVALERAEQLARQQGVSISTKHLDIETSDAGFVEHLDCYDNIIVLNYKPTDVVWQALSQLVAPRGTVLFCTFNTEQARLTGFSLKFCIEPGSGATPPPGFELISYETVREEQKSRDGYVYRRLLEKGTRTP